VAKEKAPWFPLYTRDFRADTNVTLMTTQQVGAYFLLLLHCWDDRVLSADLERLRALTRCSENEWPDVWKAIEPCFTKTRHGYTHKRLDAERSKRQEFTDKQRSNAKARWDKRSGNATAMPPHPSGIPTAVPNVCSSSSSSSSSSEEKKESARVVEHPALASQLPKHGINPQQRPNPNIVNHGDSVELVRWQFEEFVKRVEPRHGVNARGKVDAWVRKVGEEVRASKEIVTEDAKTWWNTKFKQAFERSGQQRRYETADADFVERWNRDQERLRLAAEARDKGAA
jgi:uncharacterized protein YdaU (DUF1376 family)